MSDDLTIAYQLGLHDMLEKLRERADEIERLRAENEKVRSLLRWDIVEDEEGLIICDGDHEKGEKCDHRRLYWQSTVEALRAENEKLRDVLKNCIAALRHAYFHGFTELYKTTADEAAAAIRESGE